MKIRQYALSLLCRRMTVLAEWEENPLWRRLYIDFLRQLEEEMYNGKNYLSRRGWNSGGL